MPKLLLTDIDLVLYDQNEQYIPVIPTARVDISLALIVARIRLLDLRNPEITLPSIPTLHTNSFILKILI